MKGQSERPIRCKYCGYEAFARDLERSCSNCFACTGCEAYLCPQCGREIVVKEKKPMTF